MAYTVSSFLISLPMDILISHLRVSLKPTRAVPVALAETCSWPLPQWWSTDRRGRGGQSEVKWPDWSWITVLQLEAWMDNKMLAELHSLGAVWVLWKEHAALRERVVYDGATNGVLGKVLIWRENFGNKKQVIRLSSCQGVLLRDQTNWISHKANSTATKCQAGILTSECVVI